MGKIFMGIDPGLSGGIATINENGDVSSVVKMPQTPMDILKHLKNIKDECINNGNILQCILEDVGHGIPGQSSSATAKFAKHNGHLEMALLALEIPTTTVTPQKWQKVFQLGSSKDKTKTQWKNILKAKAQQLFPSISSKITLCTCDALLMAWYGKEKA